MTWAEYADQACRVAGASPALGVQPGERVVLMMRNRPEFHPSDVGVMLAGATPISIYNSSSPEQIEYLASHSEAVAAIVGDVGMLERFLKVRSELPDLRHLILIDDPDGLAPSERRSLLPSCSAPTPSTSTTAAARVRPEDLLTLIYTSGTTGPPKGVMISHYNLCWVLESMVQATGEPITGWRQVSFLPMAHIAERLVTHYFHIGEGTDVTTCPEPGGAGLVPPGGPARALPRRAPGVGEALRRDHGRRVGRPGEAGRLREGAGGGSQGGRRPGDRPPAAAGAGRRLGAGRRRRLRQRPQDGRPRRDPDRLHRRGPDPAAGPRLLPRHRRAVLRGLRPVGGAPGR